MTEFEKLKKEYNLKLKENRNTKHIMMNYKALLDMGLSEAYAMKERLSQLKYEEVEQASMQIRLPRIKNSAKLKRLLTKPFLFEYQRHNKTFFHVLEMIGGQWVYRVFGIVFKYDRTKEGKQNRYYYQYHTDIKSYHEVYREYEDGRVFKSSRIYSTFFFVTFNDSPDEVYNKSGRPLFYHKTWKCKWGITHLLTPYETDPALHNCPVNFVMELDVMKKLRQYKSSSLCRQLLKTEFKHLAFDGRLLKFKADKITQLKNFYNEIKSSPNPIFDIKFEVLNRLIKNKITYKEFYIEGLKNLYGYEKMKSVLIQYNIDLNRVLSYLFKQKGSTPSKYKDYIELLVAHNYPLSYSLLFPSNLIASHDALNRKNNKDKLFGIELKRSIHEHKILTNYLNSGVVEQFIDGVLMKPFYSASDFNTYGVYLNHCYKDIDSYFNELVNGNRFMLLLMNPISKEPLSVATVDLKDYSILFNNGKRDKSLEELNSYVFKYIKTIKKGDDVHVI